jgi:hypothetical protein
MNNMTNREAINQVNKRRKRTINKKIINQITQPNLKSLLSNVLCLSLIQDLINIMYSYAHRYDKPEIIQTQYHSGAYTIDDYKYIANNKYYMDHNDTIYTICNDRIPCELFASDKYVFTPDGTDYNYIHILNKNSLQTLQSIKIVYDCAFLIHNKIIAH